jgi:branched-chain amino acid transport system substrate-binding protein
MQEDNHMLRRQIVTGAVAIAIATFAAGGVAAQDTVKIGLILPMTGPFTSTGKQIVAAIRLYMQQNGTTVAGKKIDLIVRDDAAVPDNTKRIAQELIVNDKVNFLAGFGITPTALAVAPLATQAKIPMIVTAAATSVITERSPYIVRTSFAQAQPVVIIADWEAKNGIKKVVTIVSDFAPGYDSESFFKERFTRAGGQVIDSIRIPLQNPDFAPFLQRARDASPDGLFVFVPAGQAGAFIRQFLERGLDKSGIKLFGAGDIMDDDVLNGMGEAAIGTVTAYFYSAAHPSEKNKAFVAAFKKANNGMRPNFFAVSGYDGMHVIYEALKKTNGSTDGDTLVNAMKGTTWESPRGPVSIDPETRDIIQNIYISKVEKVSGELYNIEFATFEAIKDPVKAAKK